MPPRPRPPLAPPNLPSRNHILLLDCVKRPLKRLRCKKHQGPSDFPWPPPVSPAPNSHQPPPPADGQNHICRGWMPTRHPIRKKGVLEHLLLPLFLPFPSLRARLQLRKIPRIASLSLRASVLLLPRQNAPSYLPIAQRQRLQRCFQELKCRVCGLQDSM